MHKLYQVIGTAPSYNKSFQLERAAEDVDKSVLTMQLFNMLCKDHTQITEQIKYVFNERSHSMC